MISLNEIPLQLKEPESIWGQGHESCFCFSSLPSSFSPPSTGYGTQGLEYAKEVSPSPSLRIFFFLCFFFFFSFFVTGSHVVQIGLDLDVWQRLTLNSSSSCLISPSTGITGVYHHYSWLQISFLKDFIILKYSVIQIGIQSFVVEIFLFHFKSTF